MIGRKIPSPLRKSVHNQRPTIGFLSDNLTSDFMTQLLLGAADAAQQYDANLLCFPGDAINDPTGLHIQSNVLYDLVSQQNVDGLLVMTNFVGTYLSHDELIEWFHEKLSDLPIVSLGLEVENYPAIFIDNYAGMHAAVTHLVEHHGYERIAFIRGPHGHVEAELRYQAYQDVLASHGLPFDPALVVTGDFLIPSGTAAMAMLLDEQKANCQAIVAANDSMAFGALEVLQERSIRVPYDMALVGFDDMERARRTLPPLTTVCQPVYAMGKQLVEMILSMLAGEDVPQKLTFPAELVVRQSCGCIDPAVTQAAAGKLSVTGESLEAFVADQREKVLSEMKQAVGTAIEGLDPDWAGQLLGAFIAELQAGKPGAFLSALDGVLYEVIAVEGQVEAWANVVSALRRCALPYLGNSRLLLQAEDLWLQAQVIVGETAQQAQRRQAAQHEERRQMLNEIGAALITTFDMNDLMDTLARELPRLGIPGCYLSLYENPKRPAEISRLVMAYDKQRGRIEPEAGKQVFPSRRLVPEGMLPLDRQYSLVVEALYFREEQLGFVLFEVERQDELIFDILREEISSALQGARLVQRVQEHSAELMRQQYILDTFMNNIPDRIYFKDTQSRITRGNGAFAIKMEVKDPDELIGKSDFDFFPLDQAEIKYQQEQEIIKTGQPILGLEEPDGIDHWVMTTKMPLRDEKGAIIGTFGVSTDITELVKAKQAVESDARKLEQAYETLQKQQQALLITEKMASLGRLTAGIAHEMNTPLAAVRAALVNVEELVKEYQASIGDVSVTDKDHYEIARELHSATQLADKAAERAAGFVHSIKSQTRNPADQEGQPINAVVAVEDALLLLSHALRQGKCELDFKKPDDEIRLVGVPGRLEQVVTNLVNNAIDASYPQGGAITVRLKKYSKFVKLQVSDHGSGILPENLSKIFDPMFSTKPFGSSTGLGLTIVHDIVVGEFGGSIDVTSTPGQGATFTIRLPLRK